MTENYVIKVAWGSFDLSTGAWHPNPLLKMSADEQFRQNQANGFNQIAASPEGNV